MSAFIPSYGLPNTNCQVVLARRPNGIPVAGDFMMQAAGIVAPEAGQFLVRNLYLSADPVQRGWAANAAVTALGAPMRALAVGVVVESKCAGVDAGDVVYGFFGWQDYALAGPADLLSRTAEPGAPLSCYAGVLGMPGVTAWLALQDIAPPKQEDAVLVSTAAGAVGSVVGQIARQAGALVVGLTGSDEKAARCVARFGYHEAYNYKFGDLAEVLAGARAGGFNTYFDNTGGWILDTAMRAMARYGRIIQCGTAATPVWNPPPQGMRNEREVLTRVLTWSGFYIFDHVARFDEAIAALSGMALEYDEEIDMGMEHAAGALEALFAGANAGKKLVFVG